MVKCVCKQTKKKKDFSPSHTLSIQDIKNPTDTLLLQFFPFMKIEHLCKVLHLAVINKGSNLFCTGFRDLQAACITRFSQEDTYSSKNYM